MGLFSHKKIVSSLCFLLFLILPVTFSYFPYLFGIPFVFGDFGVYEGTRLVFIGGFLCIFLSILLFPYILFLFRKTFAYIFMEKYTKVQLATKKFALHTLYKGVIKKSNTCGLLFFMSCCFLSIFCQFIYGVQLGNWFFGSTEFHLGLFWYTSIAVFGWGVYILSNECISLAIRGTIISLLFVLGYSFVQFFELDPIKYSTPFESQRVFSTLGNPNTLATYLLLFIPLSLYYLKDWKAWFSSIVLLAVIATTQSWSAFILGSLVICIHLLRISSLPKILSIFLGILLSLSLFDILQTGDLHSKLLGLYTRLEIFQSSIVYSIQPYVYVYGGSEIQYYDYFNTYRSASLLHFIPSTHVLVHSHNFFLDFFMRFGLIGIIGLIGGLYMSFRVYLKKGLISWICTPRILSLIFPFFIMTNIHHIEWVVWLVFFLLLRFMSGKSEYSFVEK